MNKYIVSVLISRCCLKPNYSLNLISKILMQRYFALNFKNPKVIPNLRKLSQKNHDISYAARDKFRPLLLKKDKMSEIISKINTTTILQQAHQQEILFFPLFPSLKSIHKFEYEISNSDDTRRKENIK